MGEYFEKVMMEMCNKVGADWSKINPKEAGWYTKHKWTVEEEKSFAEWFKDYLFNNKEAREEILNYPTKDKTKISDAVNDFLFNFGWKTK